MLSELHIKNIAVIPEVNINFNKGFNVLTGETGAGKSILIDSINMALGAKTSKDLIRNGEIKASVDVCFENINNSVINMLKELELDTDSDELILSRQITSEGKSSCRVNGRPVPLVTLKEIGSILIDIHGQNDNQSLLNSKYHINYLDLYGNLLKDREEYYKIYTEIKDIKSEIEKMSTDETEKERKLSLLNFQIEEIGATKLKKNEDEELESRLNYLSNIEGIISGTQLSYSLLYDDENSDSAYDRLLQATKKISELTKFDKKFDELYERLDMSLTEIEDISSEIKTIMDKTDFDQSELTEIEDRISVINILKRKYGNSIEEILAFYDKISEEVENLTLSDEKLKELNERLEVKETELKKVGKELSEKRSICAKSLESKIINELRELDMEKVKFHISVNSSEPNSFGMDDVEFLISTNPGEALKPMIKIASGGELSRIMLAMKTVLVNSDKVDTIIFDEIDTGVSGRAAQKIAEKVSSLSASKQVFAITHLAQIAAMADSHYLIEKHSDDNNTVTDVKVLDSDMRKKELARIIGGVKVTELTVQAAEEMVELAEKFKSTQKKQ